MSSPRVPVKLQWNDYLVLQFLIYLNLLFYLWLYNQQQMSYQARKKIKSLFLFHFFFLKKLKQASTEENIWFSFSVQRTLELCICYASEQHHFSPHKIICHIFLPNKGWIVINNRFYFLTLSTWKKNSALPWKKFCGDKKKTRALGK